MAALDFVTASGSATSRTKASELSKSSRASGSAPRSSQIHPLIPRIDAWRWMNPPRLAASSAASADSWACSSRPARMKLDTIPVSEKRLTSACVRCVNSAARACSSAVSTGVITAAAASTCRSPGVSPFSVAASACSRSGSSPPIVGSIRTTSASRAERCRAVSRVRRVAGQRGARDRRRLVPAGALAQHRRQLECDLGAARRLPGLLEVGGPGRRARRVLRAPEFEQDVGTIGGWLGERAAQIGRGDLRRALVAGGARGLTQRFGHPRVVRGRRGQQMRGDHARRSAAFREPPRRARVSKPELN